MGRKKRIDWPTLEAEYVTTNTSYRALAERHGIDHHVIAQAGKREGWFSKRKEYRKKLQKKAEEKAIDAAVRNIQSLENVASKAINSLNIYFDGDISYEPKDFKLLTGAVRDLMSVVGELKGLCSAGDKDKDIHIRVELPEEIEDFAE